MKKYNRKGALNYFIQAAAAEKIDLSNLVRFDKKKFKVTHICKDMISLEERGK